MEAVDYAVGSKPALQADPNESALYVKAGVKTFAEAPNVPHIMLHTKRLAIYNRQPKIVKFVHRVNRNAVDVEFAASILHMTTVHYDLDLVVCVLDNGSVSIYKVDEMPNTELRCANVTTVEGINAERCFSFQLPGTTHSTSSPLAGKALLFINAKGDRTVYSVENQKALSSGKDQPRAPLDATSVGFVNGLVALPSGAQGQMTLVRADTFAPMIQKPWFPHETGCCATRVLSAGKSNGLVTFSNDFTELRIWAFTSGAIALLQTLNFTFPEGISPAPRQMVFDKDESYAFLWETNGNSVLVCEFTDDRTAITRITDWHIGGAGSDASATEPLLSLAPVLRKVNANGTTITNMTLFVRTPNGICRHVLDNNKLDGDANVGSAGDEAEDSKKNPTANVKKWFAESSASPASLATPSSIQAHITSMQGGQTRINVVDNAAAERQTQEALAKQQEAYRGSLQNIHRAVLGMEKQANENLSVLRSAEAQRNAQAAGRSSGQQVAAEVAALAKRQAANNGGGSSDEVHASEQALEAFLMSIRHAVSMTASQCLVASLNSVVPTAVDRCWTTQLKPAFDKRDDVPLPKMSTLPSMVQFCEQMDKAHGMQTDLIRRQRDSESAKCGALARRVRETADASIKNGKAFLKNLQDELHGLSDSIEECKSVVGSSFNAAGPAIPPKETDEAAFAAAEKLAKQGEWKLAVQKIVQHGSIPASMRFLATDFVKENRDRICGPAVLSIPSFITLLQHVTHDMMSSTGMLPMRIDWAHALAVGMDESLSAPATAEDQKLIEASALDFANILDSLDAVDVKGSLDASSRRKHKLIRKVISAYQ